MTTQVGEHKQDEGDPGSLTARSSANYVIRVPIKMSTIFTYIPDRVIPYFIGRKIGGIARIFRYYYSTRG